MKNVAKGVTVIAIVIRIEIGIVIGSDAVVGRSDSLINNHSFV